MDQMDLKPFYQVSHNETIAKKKRNKKESNSLLLYIKPNAGIYYKSAPTHEN